MAFYVTPHFRRYKEGGFPFKTKNKLGEIFFLFRRNKRRDVIGMRFKQQQWFTYYIKFQKTGKDYKRRKIDRNPNHKLWQLFCERWK